MNVNETYEKLVANLYHSKDDGSYDDALADLATLGQYAGETGDVEFDETDYYNVHNTLIGTYQFLCDRNMGDPVSVKLWKLLGHVYRSFIRGTWKDESGVAAQTYDALEKLYQQDVGQYYNHQRH